MLNKTFALILTASFAIYSQIYAQIEDKKNIVAKNAQLVKVADGFTFTEGPAVHRNGDVFFTDQPNDQILKWSATRNEVSVFKDNADRSNGMFFDRMGNLITCADEDNQLWSIDDKGNAKVLIENFKGKLLNGPNDLWIAPNGGIYITDPLYKRPYWSRDPEMQQDGEHLYYLAPNKLQFFRVD